MNNWFAGSGVATSRGRGFRNLFDAVMAGHEPFQLNGARLHQRDRRRPGMGVPECSGHHVARWRHHVYCSADGTKFPEQSMSTSGLWAGAGVSVAGLNCSWAPIHCASLRRCSFTSLAITSDAPSARATWMTSRPTGPALVTRTREPALTRAFRHAQRATETGSSRAAGQRQTPWKPSLLSASIALDLDGNGPRPVEVFTVVHRRPPSSALVLKVILGAALADNWLTSPGRDAQRPTQNDSRTGL